MTPLRPSRTAQGAAMHRAAHQILDRPLVFEDALALAIIGREAETELRQGRDWHGLASPGLRAFVVARSRLTEDLLAIAAGRSVCQYLLLGAGLDTYGCRHPNGTAPLTIFEIDHPATQAWKQARLREAGIAVPANLIFGPLDFERDGLGEGLGRAGFDFGRPAFVAWLGVTPYLSRQHVMTTLELVATRFAKGSEMVFDYAEPVRAWDTGARMRLEALSARVALADEPFRSFFEAGALAREASAMGFSAVEDWDAPALNARYFEGRSDGLQVVGRAHLLHATV